VRAKSSDGSDETDDVTDFSLSALAKRVEQIKRDEASGTTTMRVIVLDATLPGQRLGLRFDRRDTKRALNAGTALGSLTEPGDTYVMLGQAPLSGQVLPMGTEVRVSRVSPFPDGSGDVEVELVGIRRLRIEGQPFDENGVAMAKTRPMDFAPEALWSTSVGDESVRGGDLDMIKGAHPAAARRGNPRDADSENSESLAASLNAAMAENLEPLVDEWKRLVVDGGHERRKGQIDLILGHLGPMPAAREPARRAVWVAALINPIPALGVAYEIRPALLMSRDTTGMLKIATDGIATSIERLRPKEEPSCSEKKKDEDDETTE
jgi:hypothetical protein